MPDGADLGTEGIAEELRDMARAARGRRTRPGEPGQRRGLGTGMLMWKESDVILGHTKLIE